MTSDQTVEDKLYNIAQHCFYKGTIDPQLCKESHDAVAPLFNQFQEKTSNCALRTSTAFNENIINIVPLFVLKSQILKHITSYMFQTKKFYDGYISNSWINIYEKNFYQEMHTHEDPINNYICGVVYLTQDNSEIHFADPLHTGHVYHKPELGDIVIFEDNLHHRVVENKKDTLRVSLAFNYVKKKVWEIV